MLVSSKEQCLFSRPCRSCIETKGTLFFIHTAGIKMLRLDAVNAGMRWTSTSAGLGSTGAGVHSALASADLVSVCGSMAVDGLHHWYPAIETDRLSCPPSLPNRYDQRGACAVVVLFFLFPRVRSWLEAHIDMVTVLRELREGCTGNSDSLQEGSLVGQTAKDRFG